MQNKQNIPWILGNKQCIGKSYVKKDYENKNSPSGDQTARKEDIARIEAEYKCFWQKPCFLDWNTIHCSKSYLLF